MSKQIEGLQKLRFCKGFCKRATFSKALLANHRFVRGLRAYPLGLEESKKKQVSV